MTILVLSCGTRNKPVSYTHLILCKEAMQYKSLITFTFRENTANAKSVLSVLGACVKCGDEIELACDGQDEQEALDALVKAIESGLGE